MSRGSFLRMGAAGVAGAALLGSAGCGSSDSGSNDVVFSFGPDDTGMVPRLIGEFNKGSKDFKVKPRPMPADTGKYFDQLRTEFQAGGGDIDVISGDVIWPAQFAVNGYISDLSDRFKDADEFLPGPIQACTYEGKLYGVPWYTDSGLLYYRKDLLEKSGYSGPPETWDQLNEMAVKVKKDAGLETGFVFQGADYEGGVCNGLEYIWTHGGDILDPNDSSKVIVESPESVAALTTWRGMITSGASPKAVLQYLEDESQAVFLRGEAAFLRIWPYFYALVGDPKQSKVETDQLGIAPIPVDKPGGKSYSTLGGYNFLINAASDKQDQAWEFIRFMTDPAQLKKNAVGGSRLPTRSALYEDEEVLQRVPVARLATDVIRKNTRPRPVSPVYSDLSLEMAKDFNSSLKGELDPEEAVKTMQQKLTDLIQQAEEA